MSTGSADQLGAVSPRLQRGPRPSDRAARPPERHQQGGRVRASLWGLLVLTARSLRRVLLLGAGLATALRQVLMRSAAGRGLLRRWSRVRTALRLAWQPSREERTLAREPTQLVAARTLLPHKPARPSPGTTRTLTSPPAPAEPRRAPPAHSPHAPQPAADSTTTLVDARLALQGADNEPSLPWEEVEPEPEVSAPYGAWHDTPANLPAAPHSASIPLEELLRLPALQVAGDLTLRQRLFDTACEASRHQADLVRRTLGSRLSGVQVASAPIRWDQNDFFRDLLERCAREGVDHFGQQAVLSRGRITVSTEEELTEVLARLDRQLRGRILRRKVSHDGENVRHRLRVLDPLTGTVHEWQVCRRSLELRKGA